MTAIIFLCAVLGVLSQKVYLSEAQVSNANRKHVTQTKFPADDIESWLTPYDGVLATENIPVYGFVEKLNTSDNSTSFGIVQYNNAMKNALEYLREHKSYALTTPSKKPPNVNQATNTVVENQNPDDINTESTTISPTIQMTASNLSSSYPTTVYPQILVIVDYGLFKILGGEVRDVILHILAHFNGVDLWFRNLESPKIRINIQAILIIEYPDFISNVQYAPNRIDGDDLLISIGTWLYNNQAVFPIDSYDIAVLMTSNNLFDKKNGAQTIGITYKEAACETLHENRVKKLAIISDIGDFVRIRGMAHELGHSLGIDHDDENDHKRCPKNDGTVMLPGIADLGPKYFEWSQCSLDQLTKAFENNNKFSCLYNKPQEQGAAVPRILPGKLINLDKQCNLRIGDTISMNEEGNCKTLTCQTKPNIEGFIFNHEWPTGPLDGSYCGQGKICLLGECVKIS